VRIAQFIVLAAAAHAVLIATHAARGGAPLPARASASSTADQSDPGFALDHDRFDPAKAWRGGANQSRWWWQASFDRPARIGAILQVLGGNAEILADAPARYVWQTSDDGVLWRDIAQTFEAQERRMFRIHRLRELHEARHLRLLIDKVEGRVPALREVEIYENPDEHIDFPDYVMAVSTVEIGEWNAGIKAGREFLPLVRRCPGWESAPGQLLWMGHFNEELARAEPRPVCALLSGNFSDWCQKDRQAWRGIDELLRNGILPIWAACGGAQGLAIISDAGLDTRWDCPHCRNPAAPLLPIYGHIGHRDPSVRRACGDYSNCLFERGKTRVLQVADDPVFEGVPREFEIMQSHCGQIENVPRGWVHLVADGPGAKTSVQCMRLKDRPIYAAQFHIEMAGTAEMSELIMANFLKLARAHVSRAAAGFGP
jgi:hypothetical protein